MKTKRLLAVLAHPDDESFGPGGTFARYAAEGVEVHIAIATDGAAGSVVDEFQSERERLAAVREKELETAVSILGGTLHTLGYRDSGYINDPANDHPDAFMRADEQEATARVIRLIRQVRPQVVITHDETGGYFHPDHIMCWKVTTPAFHAAGDMTQFPELGEPYQPQRLYYTAFPNRLVKMAALFMRLRGDDPTKVGRNKDIDLTRLGVDPKSLHAFVAYRDYWDVKQAASAAHASQGGGAGGGPRWFPVWIQRRFLARDTYIRAYPPVTNGFNEGDLFAGVVDE
jgi:LmbE family N-acetylglucosaminyl deacetylase